MHRTQLLLEERQYRFLQALAKQNNKSLSAVLREIVETHIEQQCKKNDPLWDIVGMAEGEPEAIAREHDKYLYGNER